MQKSWNQAWILFTLAAEVICRSRLSKVSNSFFIGQFSLLAFFIGLLSNSEDCPILFLLRHWGHPGPHARQRGDSCSHRCWIASAQAGEIYPEKKSGEKCQNYFCIFSLMPGALSPIAADLQTFVWGENVQSVRLQQWDLLQISRFNGLKSFNWMRYL